MKKRWLILIALLIQISVSAQNQVQNAIETKTDWWGDMDGYLNQQANFSLGLANEALLKNPPSLKETNQRKMALLLLDNVLHEEKAAFRPAVQSFLKQRIELAVTEISNVKISRGAMIWKLYDHAFVVKTASTTIGFDIQRGVPNIEGFTLSKEIMLQLINQLDILFVSHYHSDHADPWIAETMIHQGKPVVTPPDVWKELNFYDKVVHPDRKAGFKQTIDLPLRGFSLSFICYPGHQGEKILNNVTLVFSPENYSFLHTGDQSNLEDFRWIDPIGDDFKVDVAMVNSWSVYPEHRLFKGIRPKLLIAGHENEMGHTIDHREPYWLNYSRLGDPKIFPWIQMAWGEKFHYLPGRKNRSASQK